MNVLVFMGKWIGRNCVEFLLRRFPNDRYTFVVTEPENDEGFRFLTLKGHTPLLLSAGSLEHLHSLDSGHFDWLLNLWGGHIFKPETLSLARKSLNIHPGYLPHCRGRDPVVWALRNELPAGLALHEIEETVDTGAIWYREEVQYTMPTSGGELYKRVVDRSWRAFCEQWPAIRGSSLVAMPQDLDTHTHVRKELFEDRQVNLDDHPDLKDFTNKLLAHDFSPSYSARVRLGEQAYDATISLSAVVDKNEAEATRKQHASEVHMSGPWVTSLETDMVVDAMENGWYGKDAYTYCETFEAEFATYTDRKYALMTPNCTTAIHLLLAGLGVGPGDEVIAPECTWIASVAPVTYTGATLVFCDIDPQTWCVTAEAIIEKITPRTKAVIAVDLYGNMPDWPEVQRLCDERGIAVIEDSAEALGSSLDGTIAGKFGIGSVFSFHRTKTITTGEGGMLTLDDDALFERCKLLRDHGRAPGEWYNDIVGFKYMPFNVQAAMGLGQLRRVDELVGKKRWILEQYRDRLSKVGGLLLNTEPRDGCNGAWCTTVVFDRSYGISKMAAMAAMTKANIPARPFFFPLSFLPAFGGTEKTGRAQNPVSYDVSERGICLPSALNMTEDGIATVCDVVFKLIDETS
jgi:perosamine synthetase